MSAMTMAKNKKGAGDTPNPAPMSTGSIRIKPDLAYKLRIIVEADKTSAADFLDPIIRGVIEMHFRRVSLRLSQLADQQDQKAE